MLPDLQSPLCGSSAARGLVCRWSWRSFWWGWLSCSFLLGSPGCLYGKVSLGENCSLAGEARCFYGRNRWKSAVMDFPFFKIPVFLLQGVTVLGEGGTLRHERGSSLWKKLLGFFQPAEDLLSWAKCC